MESLDDMHITRLIAFLCANLDDMHTESQTAATKLQQAPGIEETSVDFVNIQSLFTYQIIMIHQISSIPQ